MSLKTLQLSEEDTKIIEDWSKEIEEQGTFGFSHINSGEACGFSVKTKHHFFSAYFVELEGEEKYLSFSPSPNIDASTFVRPYATNSLEAMLDDFKRKVKSYSNWLEVSPDE